MKPTNARKAILAALYIASGIAIDEGVSRWINETWATRSSFRQRQTLRVRAASTWREDLAARKVQAIADGTVVLKCGDRSGAPRTVRVPSWSVIRPMCLFGKSMQNQVHEAARNEAPDLGWQTAGGWSQTEG